MKIEKKKILGSAEWPLAKRLAVAATVGLSSAALVSCSGENSASVTETELENHELSSSVAEDMESSSSLLEKELSSSSSTPPSSSSSSSSVGKSSSSHELHCIPWAPEAECHYYEPPADSQEERLIIDPEKYTIPVVSMATSVGHIQIPLIA